MATPSKPAEKTLIISSQTGTAQTTYTVAAQTQSGALAVVDDNMLLEHAGAGQENTAASDIAIPFLVILQSGSPQCKKSSGKYVEGAEEGMLFNTVTKELFGNSTEVIPCHYEHVLIEWIDRETGGGGFVKQYKANDPIKRRATRNEENNRDYLPNGHILSDHAQHYCLHKRPDGSLMPVLVTMTSTQLKKSRQWNFLINSVKIPSKDGPVTPASCSNTYVLRTVPETKDTNSWFGWHITMGKRVTGAEYNTGLALFQAVREGLVKTAPPPDGSGGSDTEIPF